MHNSVRRMASLSVTKAKFTPRYYDVGVNITDPMFSGDYRGKKHHRNDMLDVLQKAYRHHVKDVLLTGSSLTESQRTIQLVQSFQQETQFSQGIEIPQLYSTVGVHPCSVLEFEQSTSPEEHIISLKKVIHEGLELGIVKAFGEIGLDYDRLHYTPVDKQLTYFKMQLELATEFDLPLFLHMRAACDDFVSILQPYIEDGRLQNKNLLVHSFTGDKLELGKLMNLETSPSNKRGYKIYISMNGASLRDQATLDAIPAIPLDRLMIETDSPWCEIKRTHPSYKYLTRSPSAFYPDESENYDLLTCKPDLQELLNIGGGGKASKKGNVSKVTLFDFLPIPIVKSERFDSFKYQQFFVDAPLIKSRNEPCLIGLVGEVVAKVMNIEPETLIDACYVNSKAVFG
jgi:TatD DNase family protein